MWAIVEVVLVAAGLGLLLGLRPPRWVVTAALGGYLALWTLFRDGEPSILIGAWLFFLPFALFLHHHDLRRRHFTRPVMELFRRVLPPMSQTEQEALQAGTVWWESDLFGGQPDWNRLLEQPPARLNPDEQAFLDGPVEELCAMLDDWQITEERRDLPPEVWAFIKERGFFGMIIPKAYGGLEFSAYAHSTVVMKLATRSITAAVTVMVPNSLGPAQLLLHYGTSAQKDYYLPRLARGEEVPCFALTGPEAGSDAAAMPDHGIVCRDNFDGREDVLGIRLNWEKRYITLGPVATVLGLAFKLYDPDHLLGDQEALGITLALIPTDTPGIEIGDRHFPLNLAFQNGPNRGRDVFIPMDWVIGGEAYLGKGWAMLMDCLADGRSISLPALSTGAGKLASWSGGAYAAVRKQFKVPIGKFEGIQLALGRIAANTYLMDAARALTACAVDAGEKPSVASAIVKYHLTERMRTVIDDAMDIHGGKGICMGPNNYLGRVYQSIPIAITVEGANILTRNLIIFGQGAVRCHPYLLTEMEAAQSADVERFDRAFMHHIALLLSNVTRALFHALTGARLAKGPGRERSDRYFRSLSRMSAAFSVVAEGALLSLGGALKRKEALSARLGDALSYLYLGSAVLKRYQDQGCPKEDWPLVQWNCEDLLYGIQQRLLEVLDNLPNRWLAFVLKRITFPLGGRFQPPRDHTTRRAARCLLSSGATRDRLTADLYVPTEPNDALAQLGVAMQAAEAAEPALRKIKEAMRSGLLPSDNPELAVGAARNAGVITDQEAEQVQRCVETRRQVIAVDFFSPDQLNREGSSWQTLRRHTAGLFS
jgi:acyl-CoA dehydrogenase